MQAQQRTWRPRIPPPAALQRGKCQGQGSRCARRETGGQVQSYRGTHGRAKAGPRMPHASCANQEAQEAKAAFVAASACQHGSNARRTCNMREERKFTLPARDVERSNHAFRAEHGRSEAVSATRLGKEASRPLTPEPGGLGDVCIEGSREPRSSCTGSSAPTKRGCNGPAYNSTRR